MKKLLKTVLAILLGIALLEVYLLTKAYTFTSFQGVGMILLAVAAAIIYYAIFERKKKK